MHKLLATAKLPTQQRRTYAHKHQRNDNQDTKVYVVQSKPTYYIHGLVFTISQSIIQDQKYQNNFPR